LKILYTLLSALTLVQYRHIWALRWPQSRARCLPHHVIWQIQSQNRQALVHAN
jgi:hypothetical protein